MKKLRNIFKDLVKDESAQGATEYILLLVVVVGLAMIFKGKITSMFTEKVDELGGNIGNFKSE